MVQEAVILLIFFGEYNFFLLKLCTKSIDLFEMFYICERCMGWGHTTISMFYYNSFRSYCEYVSESIVTIVQLKLSSETYLFWNNREVVRCKMNWTRWCRWFLRRISFPNAKPSLDDIRKPKTTFKNFKYLVPTLVFSA